VESGIGKRKKGLFSACAQSGGVGGTYVGLGGRVMGRWAGARVAGRVICGDVES
jgi:hypothetical protein